MENKNTPELAAGISTETKPDGGGDVSGQVYDPALNPAPHPVGAIARGQIAQAEQGMGEVNRDLQGFGATDAGPGGASLQHIDFTGDPLFEQIVQHYEQWGRQARMVPEQFGALLGQSVARWASMQGVGVGAALSCLHQCTAWITAYGLQGGTGLTGLAGLGTQQQQNQVLETAAGKPGV